MDAPQPLEESTTTLALRDYYPGWEASGCRAEGGAYRSLAAANITGPSRVDKACSLGAMFVLTPS